MVLERARVVLQILAAFALAIAVEVTDSMNSSLASTQHQPVMPVSEVKRQIEPPWPASPPELMPINEPYPRMPQTAPNTHPQPNYYLPPAYGNQYAPAPPSPPTTEFRSEHYAYPFEPSYFSYPVAQGPSIDASLVPTAKHFVIVSFIGLLLLFAVIQNSIAAAKRKDALVEVLASHRKKRDLIFASSSNFRNLTPEVESALKEDARIRCIQRTLCFENRKLLEDLGIFGKVLAKYLTHSVQQSLKDSTPGWDRLVEDAAEAGLRNEDCDVLYRDCNFEVSSDSKLVDDEVEDGEEEEEYK
ncbi:uncharacterized protein LOC106641140 [Copidosoma floridanum]|uniref:uncharacterized protein LOC106641140 n=1 Tax=Copidosoma floridanum TaxID=29053 RepID=UPI0006C98AAC|nr:uncharacterized protein LOC106641140 [Copidosoma floridanum]